MSRQFWETVGSTATLHAIRPLYGFSVQGMGLSLRDDVGIISYSQDVMVPFFDNEIVKSYFELFSPDTLLWCKVEIDVELKSKLDNPTDASSVLSPHLSLFLQASSLVTALRLFKSGEFRTGNCWTFRTTPGNKSAELFMADHSMDLSSNSFLTSSDADPYKLLPEEYESLLIFLNGFDYCISASKNRDHLRFACSYFHDSYADKQEEKRVLDLCTCLEALLSNSTEEITFRLSQRVANLIGNSADERVQAAELVKSFYGIRSKIIHGTGLKEKQRALMETKFKDFKEVVRKTLIGVLGISSLFDVSSDQFFAIIDRMNLDEEHRDKMIIASSALQQNGLRIIAEQRSAHE